MLAFVQIWFLFAASMTDKRILLFVTANASRTHSSRKSILDEAEACPRGTPSKSVVVAFSALGLHI